MPDRKEQSDIYEIKQYEKETYHEFVSADELIPYLELNVNTPYTIYWENLNNLEPRFANYFFTNDNDLIVGLGCNANEKTEHELLIKLLGFCGTTDGYITYEQPAPNNSSDFLDNVGRTNTQ